jgi:hypothetical protein
MKETPQLVDIKLVKKIRVTETKWVEQKGSME